MRKIQTPVLYAKNLKTGCLLAVVLLCVGNVPVQAGGAASCLKNGTFLEEGDECECNIGKFFSCNVREENGTEEAELRIGEDLINLDIRRTSPRQPTKVETETAKFETETDNDIRHSPLTLRHHTKFETEKANDIRHTPLKLRHHTKFETETEN